MTGTQRLRHLISEKGRGLSAGACDITEGAPRMASVTAKFGLCGRSEMDDLACNRVSSLVCSSDVELSE